mmetsp:Transcript_6290/g.8758  ORF Transcript_6290/g.8758 Transcript_6290/m.8758 type:complete len:334 (+) Transcript_6290:142-1143(+)
MTDLRKTIIICEGGYPGDQCDTEALEKYRIIMFIAWTIAAFITTILSVLLFRGNLCGSMTPKKVIFLFSLLYCTDRALGFLLGLCGIQSLMGLEFLYALGLCFSFSTYCILVLVWHELYEHAKTLTPVIPMIPGKLKKTFVVVNIVVYIILILARLTQGAAKQDKASKVASLGSPITLLILFTLSAVVFVQGIKLLRELQKIKETTSVEKRSLFQMTVLIVNVAILVIAIPLVYIMARMSADSDGIAWLYASRVVEFFGWATTVFGLFRYAKRGFQSYGTSNNTTGSLAQRTFSSRSLQLRDQRKLHNASSEQGSDKSITLTDSPPHTERESI